MIMTAAFPEYRRIADCRGPKDMPPVRPCMSDSIEQACGRFYAFLARHADSHQEEAQLGAELEGMVMEERGMNGLAGLISSENGSGEAEK